MNDVTLFII